VEGEVEVEEKRKGNGEGRNEVVNIPPR